MSRQSYHDHLYAMSFNIAVLAVEPGAVLLRDIPVQLGDGGQHGDHGSLLTESGESTGTGVEVTPMGEITPIAFGAGGSGPVTHQIQKVYVDLVGGLGERHLVRLSIV